MALPMTLVKLVLVILVAGLATARTCPDKVTSCEDTNTCCPSRRAGKDGCCPYDKAVCCSDKIHCCPKDNTCDVARRSCLAKSTSSLLSIFQNLLRFQPQRLPMVALSHDEAMVETVPEEDAVETVPEDASAHIHGSVRLEFQGRHYPALLSALNNGTHLVLAPCPDSSTCPDTYTCCPFADKSYGCCPYSNAVCCPDHLSCCPHNTACTDDGTCRKN